MNEPSSVPFGGGFPTTEIKPKTSGPMDVLWASDQYSSRLTNENAYAVLAYVFQQTSVSLMPKSTIT